MELKAQILWYRTAVLILTLFYFVYAFATIELEKFGWQFRFLTNWALTMSVMSAYFMLQRSLNKTDQKYEVFASTTVILNIMVVILYWKIYFEDPTQFYEDGIRTIPLWQEYYLHLAGPILQWIDAFFILGVFRPIKRILTTLVCVNAAYILWLELLVRPLNGTPIGTVTTGLPYRFLNNLEFPERIVFYAQNTILAVVLALVCWLVLSVIRRFKTS